MKHRTRKSTRITTKRRNSSKKPKKKSQTFKGKRETKFVHNFLKQPSKTRSGAVYRAKSKKFGRKSNAVASIFGSLLEGGQQCTKTTARIHKPLSSSTSKGKQAAAATEQDIPWTGTCANCYSGISIRLNKEDLPPSTIIPSSSAAKPCFTPQVSQVTAALASAVNSESTNAALPTANVIRPPPAAAAASIAKPASEAPQAKSPTAPPIPAENPNAQKKTAQFTRCEDRDKHPLEQSAPPRRSRRARPSITSKSTHDVSVKKNARASAQQDFAKKPTRKSKSLLKYVLKKKTKGPTAAKHNHCGGANNSFEEVTDTCACCQRFIEMLKEEDQEEYQLMKVLSDSQRHHQMLKRNLSKIWKPCVMRKSTNAAVPVSACCSSKVSSSNCISKNSSTNISIQREQIHVNVPGISTGGSKTIRKQSEKVEVTTRRACPAVPERRTPESSDDDDDQMAPMTPLPSARGQSSRKYDHKKPEASEKSTFRFFKPDWTKLSQAAMKYLRSQHSLKSENIKKDKQALKNCAMVTEDKPIAPQPHAGSSNHMAPYPNAGSSRMAPNLHAGSSHMAPNPHAGSSRFALNPHAGSSRMAPSPHADSSRMAPSSHAGSSRFALNPHAGSSRMATNPHASSSRMAPNPRRITNPINRIKALNGNFHANISNITQKPTARCNIVDGTRVEKLDNCTIVTSPLNAPMPRAAMAPSTSNKCDASPVKKVEMKAPSKKKESKGMKKFKKLMGKGKFPGAPDPSTASRRVPTFIAMVKTAIRDLKPFHMTNKEGIAKYIEIRYRVRNYELLRYVLKWMTEMGILRRKGCCYFFCQKSIARENAEVAECNPPPCKPCKPCNPPPCCPKSSNKPKKQSNNDCIFKDKTKKKKCKRKKNKKSNSARGKTAVKCYYRKKPQKSKGVKCKRLAEQQEDPCFFQKAQKKKKSRGGGGGGGCCQATKGGGKGKGGSANSKKCTRNKCDCLEKLNAKKNRIKVGSRYVRKNGRIYQQHIYV